MAMVLETEAVAWQQQKKEQRWRQLKCWQWAEETERQVAEKEAAVAVGRGGSQCGSSGGGSGSEMAGAAVMAATRALC